MDNFDPVDNSKIKKNKQKKSRMGHPISKAAAIQPDEKNV